jgi:hypothetical protein
LVTASSTVASTTPWIASFANASQGLQNDILSIGSTVVHVLSRAVYATVGIFEKVYAKEVHTDELCVSDSTGETCITRGQLDTLLANAANSQSSGSGAVSASGGSGGDSTDSSTAASPSATSTPPQISVNGNNPATVQVGATYLDLGATITGPQADINLGIWASVDGGATTTTPTIDTSQPGTHTIIYTATDQSGLVGTASRMVNVVAASSSPPADSGSSASSTIDTSSSTDSTSTDSSTASSSAATSTSP